MKRWCGGCIRLVALLASLLLAARSPLAVPLGGDFTLASAEGDVSLASFRGKVVAVYFGYMSCPDLCPTTMSVLGGALRLLDEAEAEQVHGLFVSLDPERDDLHGLLAYARYFHPRITGVTGPPDAIEAIAKRYRVQFARVPGRAPGEYAVDHTSRLVLVGRDGTMRRLLPDGTPPEAVVDAIRALLVRPGD